VGILVVLVAASSYAAPRDFGTVKVDGKNVAIELTLGPKTKIVVTPKGTRFPVGTYTPKIWTYMKRDGAGKVWSITGWPTNFTVEKNQTTVLENIALIEVIGAFGSRRQDEKTGEISYGVYPEFKAPDGQRYESYTRKGTRRMVPKYRIEDERGRVLAQGRFGFG